MKKSTHNSLDTLNEINRATEEVRQSLDQQLKKRGFSTEEMVALYENMPIEVKTFLDTEVRKALEEDVLKSGDSESIKAWQVFLSSKGYLNETAPLDVSVHGKAEGDALTMKPRLRRTRRWV